MTQEEEQQTKKRKRVGPVIVPKHISEWIKQNSTNTRVNNWKVGGAHSYNARNQ